MRCLITGCDGFLGANLAKMLLAQGHEVVGTALSRKGHTSLDALGVNVRTEYGDVTDYSFIERVINAYEAEWVFHLAAVSIVRIADDRPARAFRTNVLGTLNVLEACRDSRNVKAILVASSDKAYGDHGGVAYTEDMPLKPTGTYEVSKACGDMIAQCYGTQHELPVTVVRCANLYGPGDLNFSRLIPNSCRRVAQEIPPVLTCGGYLREWLHVEDAVYAYIALADRGERGAAYNIGSGESATAEYIAGRISTLGKCGPPIEQSKLCYEIPAQVLDTKRIRALHWMSLVSLDYGLTMTYHWYQDYLKESVYAHKV